MRNVVLVTVDSLRADHCGYIGGGDLTPTLDEMAAEGVGYETAIAPGPRTPSSMPVIWTGEHLRHRDSGVYDSWPEKQDRTMERRRRIRRHLTRYRTIPERFREKGYNTAAVTTNPWTERDTGFDRGFDTFYSPSTEPGIAREDAVASILGPLTKDGWLLRWRDYYDVVKRARSQLREPYFLWVFLLDPHQPYLAARADRAENTWLGMYYAILRYNRGFEYTDDLPAHLDSSLQSAYRDTIRAVDDFLDRLTSEFGDDDPVTVIHSDHGEAFHEHGFYGHRPHLYEENLHVPLVVHGRKSAGPVDEIMPLRRLPRLLASCTSSEFDADSHTAEAVIAKTEEAERVAVRTDPWKYITGGGRWDYVLAQGEELYDLDTDPGERTNRVAEHPVSLERLRARLALHGSAIRERSRINRAVGMLSPDRLSPTSSTPLEE